MAEEHLLRKRPEPTALRRGGVGIPEMSCPSIGKKKCRSLEKGRSVACQRGQGTQCGQNIVERESEAWMASVAAREDLDLYPN